jgi:hypothetical protein
MGWFRRSRPAPTSSDDRSLVPVPVATAPELARTERALQMLATQSAQLHSSIVQLEHRVDAMSESLVEQLGVASYEDVVDARLHTARVAAELSRLEINIAARIDAVRAEVRGTDGEIDLRQRTPVDTGF